MPMPSFVRSFASVPLIILVACSSADGDRAESSSESLASPTSTFLIPTDDAVRVACRSVWTTRFCDAADAQKAGDACVAAMADAPACASGGCFALQTTREACSAPAPAYPDRASCATPRWDNCAFYSACVESASACGESGYALGYGEKYCTRYLLDTRFSSTGMVWRDQVMHCLQESLVPVASEAPPASCDTILNDAFDSHPRCYTGSPSICFLPPSDVLQVVSVIDGKDLLSLRSAKQMAAVAGTCILQIGGWLLGARARDQALPLEMGDEPALRAQLAAWQNVAQKLEAEPRAAE